MQVLRSRELQKIADKTSAILDETNVKDQSYLIDNICNNTPNEFPDKIRVGETVIRDLDVDSWFSSTASSRGGSVVMRHILHNPIADTSTLKNRAIAASTRIYIGDIATYEPTVLWALSLPTNISDAWPLNMLFPSWPIVRYVNFVPGALTCLHVYRGYISPLLSVAYPLSGVFGPYFYLKKYMHFNITFYQYITFLRIALYIILKPTASLRQNVTKYVTALIYVVLFAYGLIQGFDMAYLVRKMRYDLTMKMNRIAEFVTKAQNIVAQHNKVLETFLPSLAKKNTNFSIENNMTSFYKLVTIPDVRQKLRDLLYKVYVIDAVAGIHKHVQGWSECKFDSSVTTRIWGMGHPLLGQQVRNPISLEKNIIITGPNAGGKTTYMKSVCANMLLAQSIGYVCAIRNRICPVQAIATSIRVHDSIGSESLFEAELKRCAAIVREARRISAQGHNAIYFLDEPMHSTPPIEGAATTMSIATYIGQLPGIRLFMTTHYHEVTRLQDMYPNVWKNVSMEAIYDDDLQTYRFPYRIRAGPSFQCIALEILKERDMPQEVVDTAIEMKNKLCEVVVDQHAS